MKSLRLLVLIASALAAAACASKPTIRSNAESGANFSAYKTYAFVTSPGTDRGGVATPLTSYFKGAVKRELDSRGYRMVEGDADLLVNFNANSAEKVDLRSTPGPTYGGYYGYRAGMYGGYYGGGIASSEVETVRYKVGTANIDLIDAARKQLVWEGIIEGKLTKKAMENPQATIDAIVTEMFKQYPGRAGA